MVNAILCNMTTHITCCGLQLVGGVSHGNTGPNRLEHFYVIVTIAKGQCFAARKTEVLKNYSDASVLAAVNRNNICRTFPPCSNLGTAYILQDGRIIGGPAAHHHLVYLLPGRLFKILCDTQLLMRNRIILC